MLHSGAQIIGHASTPLTALWRHLDQTSIILLIILLSFYHGAHSLQDHFSSTSKPSMPNMGSDDCTIDRLILVSEIYTDKSKYIDDISIVYMFESISVCMECEGTTFTTTSTVLTRMVYVID